MTSIDRRLTLVFARLAASGVALIVVIIQVTTHWYLGTAIIGAVIVSVPLTWHVTERYAQRERGLKFGPFGMGVAAVCVWLLFSGLSLLFFYFPAAVWLS